MELIWDSLDTQKLSFVEWNFELDGRVRQTELVEVPDFQVQKKSSLTLELIPKK